MFVKGNGTVTYYGTTDYFTGETPKTYSVAYLPAVNPMFVQLTVGATPVRLQLFEVY